mmetsp:Transcript_64978/g.120986  ORF Transcript_64978/g.120986 Transcript_64978/m.120986 type:complete len:134 (-) Transcript_64978:68-469(-)
MVGRVALAKEVVVIETTSGTVAHLPEGVGVQDEVLVVGDGALAGDGAQAGDVPDSGNLVVRAEGAAAAESGSRGTKAAAAQAAVVGDPCHPGPCVIVSRLLSSFCCSMLPLERVLGTPPELSAARKRSGCNAQ